MDMSRRENNHHTQMMHMFVSNVREIEEKCDKYLHELEQNQTTVNHNKRVLENLTKELGFGLG